VFSKVSGRLQIILVVSIVAVIAAGSVVGVTLATRQTPTQPQAQPGKPPLGPNLPTPAAAKIRAAFRDWPKGGIDTMQELGREYPRDPVVQLYRGIALIWAGYPNDAEDVLRLAKRVGRDTPWEIQADSVLHPQFQVGYPTFQPLTPNALLERGARLMQEGRVHSARRTFDLAVRRMPQSDEARVAAAVARFDKDNLNASFSRLGPLTRQFPKSQIVRYYLGLLLAWTGQRDPAIAQFERAVKLAPTSELGLAAAQFLAQVKQGGTGSSTK
jgi:tetratricopeptide (TPR) repeat protein